MTKLGSMTAPLKAKDATGRQQKAGAVDEAVVERVAFAIGRLRQEQRLHGSATQRLSVRIDPGLLEAAQARTGLATPSEIVTAALALLAADDGFGAWLVAQRGRLDESFELPL